MLAMDKAQSSTFSAGRNDEKEINNISPLIKQFNSIQNISNNKLLKNEIAIGVQVNTEYSDAAAGDQNSHWRSELSADEQRELRELMAIVNKDSLANTLSDAPKKIRFFEALIRGFAHIRLSDHIYDGPSVLPFSTDNNFTFSTSPLIKHNGLSLINITDSNQLKPMKKNGFNWTNFTSKRRKTQRHRHRHMQRVALGRPFEKMPRIKRDGNIDISNTPAAACIFKSKKLDHWMQLFQNKKIYPLFNKDLNKSLFGINFSRPYEPTFSHHAKSNGLQTVLRGSQASDQWLHTYGLSQEFLTIGQNGSIDLIDTLLSEILYRKYGFALTSEQFSRNVELHIIYKKKPEDENEPLKHFSHGSRTIRNIFLQEPYSYFIELHPEGNERFTVIRTNIKGSDKDNLLSYLEFILNGESIRIMDEFSHVLRFISASQDINDAYKTMAKNRLVAALLSIMDNSVYQKVRYIAEHWMDGLLKEKLVSFKTSENHFIVPGMVAITEAAGGLLISITTGALYLWTPADASNELQSFISSHLSLQQQTLFESISLTPYLDSEACILYPAIILTSSTDLWQDLKNLEVEKLDEHLQYYSLTAAGPAESEHEHDQLQRLSAAGSAVAILAFFVGGGSAAGCVAMMLGNLVAGTASSAFYLQRALGEKDAHRRSEAWHSALFDMIITGLGGADDMYTLIKNEGSHEYTLLHGAAIQIEQALGLGSIGGEAETFILKAAPERMVTLLEGLLRNAEKPFDMFGQNSVQAMARILRICGRISEEQYQYAIENSYMEDILKFKITIDDNAILRSMPAGKMMAIVDNQNHNLRLMLLCLGNNRFAGYNLQELDQTLHSSGWQVVNNNHFRFINNELVLTNGDSATVYIENFNTEMLAPVTTAAVDRDSIIATKFRRYCNLYKFNNIEGLLNGVERFAVNNGFSDIQYRALFIFDPRLEAHTFRHYILVAEKDEIKYIFEPHAENIRFIKLSDIEDVTILTEEQWSEIFKNSESGALITYKDFPSEQKALDYKHSFDIYGDNEKLLLSPPGFIDLMQPSEPITFSMFMSHYGGVEQQLLLQKKVRTSIATDRTSKNNYEFLLSILKGINVVTQTHKGQLLALYKDNPESAIKEIIYDPIPVKSFIDMLRIEPGKLVRFTEMDDSAISHIMICIGNGRFAGMDNSILDSALTDEKRILVGEQLGMFHDGALYSYEKQNRFIVEKGDFQPLKMPHKSLMEIAQDLEGIPNSEKNNIRFALNMLVTGKLLVPQQADALERLATLMVSKLDGDKLSMVKLNKFLAIDKFIHNTAELNEVEPGKLVVFYTEDKDFHPLVSLGNNRFAGINNYLLNDKIESNNIIISTQDIGEIVDGKLLHEQKNFKVVVGDANLEKTRIAALLGPDGRIEFIRHGLDYLQMEVKAHGALASINHYDAIELSDIIKGIHRSNYPDKPLNHIELISCFGALGGRRSSAQVISTRLGAKVESYRGIISDSKSRKRGSGVIFLPETGYGSERIRENERWHRRIHNFIEDALHLFGRLPFQRHERAIDENTPFAIVVIDVLHFLRKEISASTLMRHYPGLMSKESLRQAALLANPTGEEEALIAAMLTIFYGNSNITNAMDAYILASEYKNQSTGSVVMYGENLLQPLYWEDIVPALATFRQLPAVTVENDLLGGSNIYISIKDDKNNLKEYMIRVGSKCNNRKLWPLLLANFFSEQSGSFPVMAGLKEQDILSMGFDFTHFHFYLNSWFRHDFSLQIDMPPLEIGPESSLTADYVHFSGRGRKTDTREDIGLGHSLLLEQDGRLALQVKDTLSMERPAGLGDSGQPPANASPLLSMPRVVVTLVENDERLIMLQRNIPTEILSNNGEIAFFIAGEINKYTRSIKVGVKNNENIVPINSIVSNFVYSDPVALQKSWILVNLIHND
ncbi:hypothetical protein [Sodalis ligni]|uniref:Papain fold dermonecrotoxin of polymorphic toxin system n=1 Tax=Sodalis ligni TaxID=2697027 RepID=A0A4R1NJN1_9GAMM|nr:hypothetical protein [Sodalis ligni]TCL04420.1 papain fold dermonecrotoxin of polymorphic toxin system [Sodalis ligni]